MPLMKLLLLFLQPVRMNIAFSPQLPAVGLIEKDHSEDMVIERLRLGTAFTFGE